MKDRNSISCKWEAPVSSNGDVVTGYKLYYETGDSLSLEYDGTLSPNIFTQ